MIGASPAMEEIFRLIPAVNIAKGIGTKRQECSKVLNRMEMEGLVQPAGVMAGVAGYKLKE